uniref:Uncharacterized protein n=1 Tax=Tanacetum cinerariifolium TaxID=118510 RepID=A0A699HD83_TANCI|nr:hypothetical protein [Tanacetum cinerariifolium]
MKEPTSDTKGRYGDGAARTKVRSPKPKALPQCRAKGSYRDELLQCVPPSGKARMQMQEGSFCCPPSNVIIGLFDGSCGSWFISPHVQNEKIYNSVKNVMVMESYVIGDAIVKTLVNIRTGLHSVIPLENDKNPSSLAYTRLERLDEITLDSLTEEQFKCFIDYYHENYPEDFESDLENLEEIYKMMNGGVENPRTQNASPSEIKELYEPSRTMYSYEQPSCLGSNFVGVTLRKSGQLHQNFEKRSIAMTHDWPIGDLDTMEDKVDNPCLQSTPQVLSSFEVYTSPMIHLKEVEETIGIPIEVEPLDHIKLEDLGLNTNTRDLFLSSKGFFSVNEPEPQLLPNFSPLDVNLGNKRGTDPPINSYSLGSFRMKVIFDEKKLGSS